MINRREMKRSNSGFTLVELMVVLAITGLFAVMAMVGYNQGFYKEYGISAEMRSVVSALHVTQWRALQNKRSVIISTGTSDGTIMNPGGWYPKVTFVTATDHPFKTGDMATFANLTAHTGMNVGRYYVTYVDATTFTCVGFTQVSDVDTDPGSPSTTRPVAMNMKNSGQLILMKQSYVDSLSTAEKKVIVNDPEYFIYNDRKVWVWDYTKASTITATDVDVADYQMTVAFDYRGLPANAAGYQLAVGKVPNDLTKDLIAAKLITISPTGKIAPGA